MFRRILCILSAAGMLLVVGHPAVAAEQRGTVSVYAQWGGQTVSGGSMTIYRMGEAVAGGYALTDGLATWTLWDRELETGEFRNWILELPRTGGVTQKLEGKEGAVFRNLEDGLYLLVQEKPAAGFLTAEPVMLRIPDGEQWSIQVAVPLMRDGESPKTGDHPAPIIGAMGLGFSITMLMLFLDERKK